MQNDITHKQAKADVFCETLPTVTLVCAVDANYIKQAEVSIPVWKKRAPGLFDFPMVMIVCVDGQFRVEPSRVQSLLEAVEHPDFRIVEWPSIGAGEYQTQRELMLSSFVHIADKIETGYMLKIDVDALPVRAVKKDDWFNVKMFNGFANRHHPELVQQPALVASPWGYTKPANQMMVLDEWAQHIPTLRQYPALNIRPDKPDARKVGHKRICSWFCYIETEFAKLCRSFCVPNRLPVPSQDGFHWYCAERLGWGMNRLKFKRKGWNNYPRIRSLKQAAETEKTVGPSTYDHKTKSHT